MARIHIVRTDFRSERPRNTTPRTSRAKTSASRASINELILWKTPASSASWDREDHLAAGYVQEKRLPHFLAPFPKPLGVARRTKSPCLARKHQKIFRSAARTADPGEPAAGIAAVEALLDDFPTVDVPEILQFQIPTVRILLEMDPFYTGVKFTREFFDPCSIRIGMLAIGPKKLIFSENIL